MLAREYVQLNHKLIITVSLRTNKTSALIRDNLTNQQPMTMHALDKTHVFDRQGISYIVTTPRYLNKLKIVLYCTSVLEGVGSHEGSLKDVFVDLWGEFYCLRQSKAWENTWCDFDHHFERPERTEGPSGSQNTWNPCSETRSGLVGLYPWPDPLGLGVWLVEEWIKIYTSWLNQTYHCSIKQLWEFQVINPLCLLFCLTTIIWSKSSTSHELGRVLYKK